MIKGKVFVRWPLSEWIRLSFKSLELCRTVGLGSLHYLWIITSMTVKTNSIHAKIIENRYDEGENSI